MKSKIRVDQVIWTKGVEAGLIENKLKDFLDKLDVKFSEVRHLVRTNISSLLSLTLTGLMNVHDRDVVDKLIREYIEKITD
jgi:hypothetical protein